MTGAEDSHMLKHQTEAHGDMDEPVDFSMKVLRKHMSAFKRQIHEAVLVEIHESEGIMNSKGIYNRCSLPRLSVKFMDKEVKELENEIEKARDRKKKRKETEIEDKKSEEEVKVGRPPLKRTKFSQNKKKVKQKDLPGPEVIEEEIDEAGKDPLQKEKDTPEKVKKVKTIIDYFHKETEKPKTPKMPKKNQNQILKISSASKMVIKSKNKANPSPSSAQPKRTYRKQSSALPTRPPLLPTATPISKAKKTFKLNFSTLSPSYNYKSILAHFQEQDKELKVKVAATHHHQTKDETQLNF